MFLLENQEEEVAVLILLASQAAYISWLLAPSTLTFTSVVSSPLILGIEYSKTSHKLYVTYIYIFFKYPLVANIVTIYSLDLLSVS